MYYYLEIECESPVKDIFTCNKRRASKVVGSSFGGDHFNFRLGEIKLLSMDFPSSKIPEVEETSLGHGVVHLYRVFPSESHEFDAPGLILAILAIPLYMSPSDVLGFLGEKHCKSIQHIRLLKTKDPNRIMALLKFKDQASVIRFYTEFNGKAFSQIDPETCHVLHIDKVNIKYPMESSDSSSTEQQLVGPSSKPFASTTPALIELPTCVVCLERMDSSITGLITIVCQHTFHCPCLQKWGNSSCPVCRYTQKVQSSEFQSKCTVCCYDKDLWICLICGNIGCGRYHDAHAKQHYVDTAHCYAMELETQRVWDYAGDNYVHRLLQSETDGKLVELSTDGKSSGWTGSSATESKLRDKMGLEYTQILVSQLESQRLYYESHLSNMSQKLSRVNEELVLKTKIATASSNANTDLRSRVDISESKLKKRDDKLKRVSSQLEHLKHDYEEEKSMNENLLVRIQTLEKQNTTKSDQIVSMQFQINDLNEQLRDLMFTISASQEIQKMGQSEELQNGTIVLPNNSTVRSNSVKSKKKKKKKPVVPSSSGSLGTD